MTHQHAPFDAILIAGPTASGKSALALELARGLGGVVVNADASQVYRDLRILTARPDEAEEREAPHALYGHVDAAEPYGVGRWLADLAAAVPSLSTGTDQGCAQAERRPASPRVAESVPIIVGGTGLYFDALTTGLAHIPEIPSAVRETWRSFGPPASLHGELSRRDPVMAARLRPSDPQRLMRALEVIDATGRSLADWQADAVAPILAPERCLRLVLSPHRAALDEKIARRLEAMVGEGAVEEAAALCARGLDPALPALKALGVRPFAAFARGEVSKADALERTRLDTRRYAKRQMTWFRNRMADWIHVAPEEALERVTQGIGRLEIRRDGSVPLSPRGRG